LTDDHIWALTDKSVTSGNGLTTMPECWCGSNCCKLTENYRCRTNISSAFLFRIARAEYSRGRRWLGAGQLGFWEFGKAGTVGWRVGQIGSVYKQPETEVDDCLSQLEGAK
jgi:hypothetical protein